MKKISTLFSSLLLISTITVSHDANAQSVCSWAKKGSATNEEWSASAATDPRGNVYSLGSFYSTNLTFGTTTLHNQPYDAFNYAAEMFLVKYDACGNFKWAKAAGGSNETRGKSVATDAAGNVFVAGYFNSDTLSFGGSSIILIRRAYWDGFVAKYDSTGIVLWARLIGGDDVDKAFALTTDNMGNVYVTGSSASDYIASGTDSVASGYSSTYDETFIVKYDNNGNVKWIRNGGGDYDAIGYGVGTDAAGNVYVGGTFGSSYIRFGNDSVALIGYNDAFIVKYDSAGAEQWLRTGGGSNDDKGLSLATDANGNSFITGNFSGSSVSFGGHTLTNSTQHYPFFIAKYDASGTVQWAHSAQGNSYTSSLGYCVKVDAAGNPYVIGYYNSDSLKLGPVTLYNDQVQTYGGGDSVYDIFVAKYTGSTGYLNWARTAGGAHDDFGFGIAPGPNNSLFISGEYMSPSVSFAGIALTSPTNNNWGDAFIANNIATSNLVPEICMVTVDTTSTHNIVMWDKTSYAGVDSFKIFREDVTNIYKHIGTVPYDSLSEFHDLDPIANPNSTTKRYKISAVDTCGLEGGKSNYHNTIYIVYAGNGQFTWNPSYTIENTTNPVNNYLLMRDDSSTGAWHQVAITAGTQNTLNDAAFASFPNVKYYVATDWAITCSPTRAIVNTSRSNIKSIVTIGIEEASLPASVTVAPNPVSSETRITSAARMVAIELYNSIGQLVIGEKTGNVNTYTISFAELAAGVYHLKIKTEAGMVYKKLLKQ